MKKILRYGALLLMLPVMVWVILQILPPFSRPFAADRTIYDLRPPVGYERVPAAPNSYADFLRHLPLKKAGTPIHLYTGGLAHFQFLGLAVVDMPLLSNDEQCADVCMRLRAEYLYSRGRYLEISFRTVNGIWLPYLGGASRKAFERYMRHVYGVCNTASLSKQLARRELKDIQPGDVFVYPARHSHMYGHAVMVVDVAVNKKGKKVFMVVEGNTPARDMHVMRNSMSVSPAWFTLHENANNVYISPFRFGNDELRHY